jgi:hypothetical protein
MVYMEGRGTTKDLSQGLRYLKLSCDSEYGPAEYNLCQYYSQEYLILNKNTGTASAREDSVTFYSSNHLQIVSLHLLVRSVLHSPANLDAELQLKKVLPLIDVIHCQLRPYLINFIIFLNYLIEKDPEVLPLFTHSSWSDPNLLWYLYDEKSPIIVFQFFKKCFNELFISLMDYSNNTLLHRLLKDWDLSSTAFSSLSCTTPTSASSKWFSDLVTMVLLETKDFEVVDHFGRSYLDLCALNEHISIFQFLIKEKDVFQNLHFTILFEFYKYLQQQLLEHQQVNDINNLAKR